MKVGIVIRVFNDSGGSTGEAWSTITVKQDLAGVEVIDSSKPDSITSGRAWTCGGSGELDGKVSRIEIFSARGPSPLAGHRRS